MVVTQRAAEAAKKSADDAHNAYMLSTRAVIEIHGLSLVDSHEHRCVIVHYVVVNSGASEARIEEQMIDLWWHFRDQPYPPYPGGLMLGDKSTPKVLESQQEFYGILESPTLEVGITGNKAFNWAEYTADNMLVYLTGKVEYLDGTNGHHVTSFCRAWSRSDRTFKILPEMPTTYNRQG